MMKWRCMLVYLPIPPQGSCTLAQAPTTVVGAADSLNVACAASILLYEADRQRRATAKSHGESHVTAP